MPEHIELRSDTFTNPTREMRTAIAEALVGDDMVGEDPTVNELESRVAALLGKEAAVFTCSATQANQAAVWAQCQRGDELLIEQAGHIANWEAGGPAVISGVSVRRIAGRGGMLTLADVESVLRPMDDVHIPRQTLLCLENTTNMGGGRVWPVEQFREVARFARSNGKRVHLDGARLFNAAVASGVSVAEWAAEVDSVSICFSKGLGCPMGAILVSDQETIRHARRARKVLGGALRQAGMMAAAAIYALDHHVDRMADDHANARRLAEGLNQIDGVGVDQASMESNIVFATVDPGLGSAGELSCRLHERGVRLFDVGPDRLRMVTHLDVSADEIEQALEHFRQVADELRTT